ncbi:hypothetical protein DdX_18514 [Ditylenchus destructor]|uniref:Uncharacterized protein n=1 Tax=Ditylenchus destructor TaxID=166010 RepID=A0AAD4QST9_9BILA|nr:hypothetical protein DdX_18514 [Ditylenchus destructor]
MKKKLGACMAQSMAGTSSQKDSKNLTQLPPGLTNMISLTGPCLHPEHVDPRPFQKEEFRSYFGQFDKITAGHCHLSESQKIADTRIAFDNCESKCIQEGTHRICGQDFVFRRKRPTKSMRKKLVATLMKLYRIRQARMVLDYILRK